MRTQSTMLTQLVSELKEKDYELKTIFNSTQNAIVIFDNNGLILNANPAAEALCHNYIDPGSRDYLRPLRNFL